MRASTLKSNQKKYNIQTCIKASKIPKRLEKSAYGYTLSDGVFAGLPASGMKGKWIQIDVHPPSHPNAVVPIGDIGPWNGGGWHKYDDPYWRKSQRPQAETGKDLRRRETDKCGIELSHKLWQLLELGAKKRVVVDWHFVASPKHKKAIIINKKGIRKTHPVT